MIHSTGSGRTEPVTTQVTPNIGTEAKWSRRHLLDVDDLMRSALLGLAGFSMALGAIAVASTDAALRQPPVPSRSARG